MKRKLCVLILFLAIVGMAAAQTINLGDFPVGKWLDPNWGAYWEFSTNNIRILDASGNVFFDFGKATVKDYKVSVGIDGVVITFSCVETQKSYKLTKPVTNLNLILEIDPPWKIHYKVEMTKQ